MVNSIDTSLAEFPIAATNSEVKKSSVPTPSVTFEVSSQLKNLAALVARGSVPCPGRPSSPVPPYLSVVSCATKTALLPPVTVIVGAEGDDDNGTYSGSAYVYDLNEAEFDCNSNGILDICDIEEEPSLDCDLDGLIDACSTADGDVEDCNENGIPDTCELKDPDNDQNNNGELDDCECVGDADGDEYVNVNDLLEVVGYWGTNAPQADLNSDGIVDVSDLLIVVGNWGPCE